MAIRKNKDFDSFFSFHSTLQPIHYLWWWWWQSHNSLSALLLTKNWIRTMVLQMHPFWYLFCKFQHKIHMASLGKTMFKLHARPEITRSSSSKSRKQHPIQQSLISSPPVNQSANTTSPWKKTWVYCEIGTTIDELTEKSSTKKLNSKLP